MAREVREYTAAELFLPPGTQILSASFPFQGGKLELVVETPTKNEDPQWDMTAGFDEQTGQGHLFSAK